MTIQQLLLAAVLCCLGLAPLPAAWSQTAGGNASARDHWGIPEQDWTTKRVKEFAKGLEKFDYERQSESLWQAETRGDHKAKMLIVVGIMTRALPARDSNEAARLLEEAAKGGLPFAQYVWGVAQLPKSVPQPKPEYLEWIKKAADNGHLVARQRLGAEYLLGKYVRRDYAKAEELYKSTHPALKPIGDYYSALALLEYNHPQRNVAKSLAMMRENFQQTQHQGSQLILALMEMQIAIGNYLMDFEIVNKHSKFPVLRVTKFDAYPCHFRFWDARDVMNGFHWGDMQAKAVDPEGAVEFTGQGVTWFFQPAKDGKGNAATTKLLIERAKDLYNACSNPFFLVDEDVFR